MNMKIAVPVTSKNQIDDHFGHCEFYNIFTISVNNEITDVITLPSVQGCGCKSNIAVTLAEMEVTLMLAGGIGGGAIYVLNNAGIEVIRGCSGDATEVVKQFIAGNISDSGESCARHESHHAEGSSHLCSSNLSE
jgi:predicted Fe-Mo cluster-binding NifX family protein